MRWSVAPWAVVLAGSWMGFGEVCASEIGVGVAIGPSTRDMVSVADIRPAARGHGLVGMDVRVAGDRWALGVAGALGGSWFDFRQESGFPSGNIEDQVWIVQSRLERLIAIDGNTRWVIGAGVEYGEWRSWTDTRLYSARGPRAFFTGGTLRLGIEQSLGRVQLHGGLDGSFFRAHASDEANASRYHWMGRSLSLLIGVRYVVSRRHNVSPP